MSVEGFKRFDALKAEAAALLGLPIDADNVKLLASMKMQHEQMIEAQCTGGKVDAGALLAVIDAIARFTPPVIPKVELEVISNPPPHHWCSVCGKTQEFIAPPPDVDPKLLPRVIDAVPLHRGGAHPASIVKPAAPPKPSAPAPKPLDYAPYNPNFIKNAPIKQSAVSGTYDRYLGSHKAPEFKS